MYLLEVNEVNTHTYILFSIINLRYLLHEKKT